MAKKDVDFFDRLRQAGLRKQGRNADGCARQDEIAQCRTSHIP
jgi:hypothetical protein